MDKKPNGETIRRVRMLRGLSHEEITERGGPSSATLVALERESKATRPSTIRKLSQALEVPPGVFFMDPEAATGALTPGPLGPAMADDPTEWLLGLLRDAKHVYRPEGPPLGWDAETFDRVIRRLGDAAVKAAGSDLAAGNEMRAVEILRLLAQVTANLEARKARLEGIAETPEEKPAQVRHDLAESDAVLRQLQALDVA